MLNQNFFYFPLLKFNFNLFNLLLTWMCHHHEQTCHLARPRKPNRKTKKCKLCKNFWTPLKISREDKNPIHPYITDILIWFSPSFNLSVSQTQIPIFSLNSKIDHMGLLWHQTCFPFSSKERIYVESFYPLQLSHHQCYP